jgi:predicted acetyltransferase
MEQSMQLVWPAQQYLQSYVAGLKRGWSPDSLRREAASREELEQIAGDHAKFLRELIDPEGKGDPITLPDGSQVPRLPGYRRWMWDGEFCGSIGFRWQPGSSELPPTCLGHIGYGVVPWKQDRGYATSALQQLLPDAKARGLAYVEITCDPDNLASQRVILKNGGVLVERFVRPAQYKNSEGLRFRIGLTE